MCAVFHFARAGFCQRNEKKGGEEEEKVYFFTTVNVGIKRYTHELEP